MFDFRSLLKQKKIKIVTFNVGCFPNCEQSPAYKKTGNMILLLNSEKVTICNMADIFHLFGRHLNSLSLFKTTIYFSLFNYFIQSYNIIVTCNLQNCLNLGKYLLTSQWIICWSEVYAIHYQLSRLSTAEITDFQVD